MCPLHVTSNSSLGRPVVLLSSSQGPLTKKVAVNRGPYLDLLYMGSSSSIPPPVYMNNWAPVLLALRMCHVGIRSHGIFMSMYMLYVHIRYEALEKEKKEKRKRKGEAHAADRERQRERKST